MWQTPAALDWKSDDPDQSPDHTPPLGRQVLQTSPDGGKPSTDGPNSPRRWPSPRAEKTDKLESHHRNATGKGKKLNPLFVEWLMGLPRNWTSIRMK